ncbi:ABC transporter ATP-binding protein [Aliihoeflea sp. 40Bstr573]|uniref:ABC transporter ATP-binding protein n=1 Tax=Aliihoeflea sp. 40Bstr573 TaxID=2696467 RepID=UPI0020961E33|nr:ABC transporter ATP-binding protein [Aliihoeflea sp. 40Bstr573]MCO6388433.1 ATP-binding cassette domain-containing protein [Aliihoeflea sp. 40Bstr573]
MLAARNLSVSLSGRPILHDVSLSLQPGEVVGLLGPNGAGKSTLMRSLSGLIPFSGTIELDGRNLAAMSDRERAREIAFLPQARAIAWPLSVENVVRLARSPWRGFGALSQKDLAIVSDAMEAMDVAALADRPVTELSGGEQARVLAARAMAQTTPVLLADEPVSGLDPAHQMTMTGAFRRLAGERRAILVSLHDLTLAARWCDRLVVMAQGRIVAEGKPADIMTSERLREVFGITAHIAHDECGMIFAPTGLAANS